MVLSPKYSYNDQPYFEDLHLYIPHYYSVETNLPKDVPLEDALHLSDVILLGESHDNPQHAEWNGAVVNALYMHDTELLIEHEPDGSTGQLEWVRPEIAKKAKQWDFIQTQTSLNFEKLIELSEMIPEPFWKITIANSKVLIYEASKLIDNYLVHPESVERVWSIVDHQMARILDDSKKKEERIYLMYKQAYLRVWAEAVLETIEQFLKSLEMEMEDRNSWMVKVVAKAFHNKKRVVLIAGTEHFAETIVTVEQETVVNPIFKYLNDVKKKYLLLQPFDEIVPRAKEITNQFRDAAHADTRGLEDQVEAICKLLDGHGGEELEAFFDQAGEHEHYDSFFSEMELLKKECLTAIIDSQIQTHDESMRELYMTGAVCLRVEKLAKTVQVWNVLAQLALAHSPWFEDCEHVL